MKNLKFALNVKEGLSPLGEIKYFVLLNVEINTG